MNANAGSQDESSPPLVKRTKGVRGDNSERRVGNARELRSRLLKMIVENESNRRAQDLAKKLHRS